MATSQDVGFSDLAVIENIVDDPVDLFRLWHHEARMYVDGAPDACCLATVSKDMRVSARNLVLREFDNDGFVIVTDSRSRKVADMENTPNTAMCFLWCYVNKDKQRITKQVRIEGTMTKLAKEQYQHIYDREPLYCKIRSDICYQDRPIDWADLKERHDKILDRVRKNEYDLSMPDHFVGYKLLPTMMDFYFAKDNFIGDRIRYDRDNLTSPWKHERISV
ncbi:hypothetical protein KM043_008196 [Ampulex compressa]|nr:hypothetical protein KM043_008196 [Ampulex compressa]